MTSGDEPGGSELRFPAVSLLTAGPPLLFQAETVDPLHLSEPGYEPHTALVPLRTAALERAPVDLAKSAATTMSGRVAALPPDPYQHLLDLPESVGFDPHAHLLDLDADDVVRAALGHPPAELPVFDDPSEVTQVLPVLAVPADDAAPSFPALGLATAFHPGVDHLTQHWPVLDPWAQPVDAPVETEAPTAGRHRRLHVPERSRKARAARLERAANRTKVKRKAPWWELPALVGLAVLIAVVVKTFVVQPFYIPSPSMERTLHGCTGCAGDRILVNKPIYDLRDPHPGDIIVFHAPTGWNTGEPVSKPPSNPVVRLVRGFGQLVGFVPPDGLVLVKRVIAVGGQTVKGVSTDGGNTEKVMISNHGDAGPWKTLIEKYVFLDGPDAVANFGPVTVPKGRLWVMGDHRNDSADSRYHCGEGASAGSAAQCLPVPSTVPIGNVIGKAVLIAWPPSRWRTLGTPSTYENAAASGLLPLGLVFPVYVRRRRRKRS